eukprot:m.206352 g.206352  ORF g.206352 m.206352 type:complete len:114 (+) comp18898_c0_seq2:1142-1483(+)
MLVIADLDGRVTLRHSISRLASTAVSVALFPCSPFCYAYVRFLTRTHSLCVILWHVKTRFFVTPSTFDIRDRSTVLVHDTHPGKFCTNESSTKNTNMCIFSSIVLLAIQRFQG